MYSGLVRLPLYPFIGWGFVLVMAVGVGLALVYAVGALGGRRAAAMYTGALVALLAAGAAADLIWGATSGQLAGVVRDMGVGPLAEMVVLGALFIGSMWFMAVRYAQSGGERVVSHDAAPRADERTEEAGVDA